MLYDFGSDCTGTVNVAAVSLKEAAAIPCCKAQALPAESPAGTGYPSGSLIEGPAMLEPCFPLSYSVLKLFTGLAIAAFTAW